MRSLLLPIALCAVPAAGLGTAAHAQESDIERRAESVARQPLKDVGLMRENPPEVLLDAQRAPYTLNGLRRCADYQRAIGQLDEVLGPDVDAISDTSEILPARLAEAGAKSIVNAFIPFRGLVREASGAAEADRKFRVMVAAGMARRGFLKGIARERKCPV